MHPTLVPAFNPGPLTGRGNNTYLLDATSGILVDAGVGDARHLSALETAMGAGAGLQRVLVTHAHPDHASGAPALAGRWPDATFTKLPWPERDRRVSVEWLPLRDGDSIAWGGGPLVAVHTPGHAPDHVVFWHAATGAVFSGDLVVSGGTVVIPVSHGGNLVEYLASLEKVLALEPARLFPAHGPVIDEPAVVIKACLDHRQRREEQIVAALQRGCRHRIDIVHTVYQDLAPELETAAGENVLAHLLKLEHEGRAAREGDEWLAR